MDDRRFCLRRSTAVPVREADTPKVTSKVTRYLLKSMFRMLQWFMIETTETNPQMPTPSKTTDQIAAMLARLDRLNESGALSDYAQEADGMMTGLQWVLGQTMELENFVITAEMDQFDDGMFDGTTIACPEHTDDGPQFGCPACRKATEDGAGRPEGYDETDAAAAAYKEGMDRAASVDIAATARYFCGIPEPAPEPESTPYEDAMARKTGATVEQLRAEAAEAEQQAAEAEADAVAEEVEMATEDLKAALSLYDLNRRNITPEAIAAVKASARRCAAELARRVGDNRWSRLVTDVTNETKEQE